jgi:cysteine dioxygenase
METIKDLAQLKYNLNLGPGYGGYIELLKAIDFSTEELSRYTQFSDQHYQRIRLYDSNLIEAVLSCWKPFQDGDIHNFRDSVTWFKVLRGKVSLENFNLSVDALEPSYTTSYEAGQMGFLNDELGFHRFRSKSEKEAIIIHLYSEKLVARTVYDPEDAEVKFVAIEVDNNFDLQD